MKDAGRHLTINEQKVMRRALRASTRLIASGADDADDLARARETVEAFPSHAFNRQHTEMLAREVAVALHEEREACARHIEALACHIRDHGPKSPEGILNALSGAQAGVLFDAAAALRAHPSAKEQQRQANAAMVAVISKPDRDPTATLT